MHSFQRAFCVCVMPNGDGTRGVFLKEVEPCEARSHMTIDEIERFVSTEPNYTFAENLHLVQQVQEIRTYLV